MSEHYGPTWAKSKLNLARRRRELDLYIDRWLIELRTSKPTGLFLDLGAGCGDLMGLARDLGWEPLGVDAPDGDGGMGNAYLSRCREIRSELRVTVIEQRLGMFLNSKEATELIGKCSVINSRGAVEQCLSAAMNGVSHDVHHNCRLLSWDEKRAPIAIAALIGSCARWLRPSGVVAIVANGSANDDFYDSWARRSASEFGLELVKTEGLTGHKWRKPDGK